MTLRLYMDHHVPISITEGLRRRGVDVITAKEDGTAKPDDEFLLARATELDRVLFSQDREPVFGAVLFVLYWLGRALSVWLAPLLMPDASITPQVLDAVYGQYQLFQHIHVSGLIWAIFPLVAWFSQGA